MTKPHLKLVCVNGPRTPLDRRPCRTLEEAKAEILKTEGNYAKAMHDRAGSAPGSG